LLPAVKKYIADEQTVPPKILNLVIKSARLKRYVKLFLPNEEEFCHLNQAVPNLRQLTDMILGE